MKCNDDNNSTEDDCWDAFGSDSDDDDDDEDNTNSSRKNPDGSRSKKCAADITTALESAADATALDMTQYFVSLMRSTEVPLKDRLVSVGPQGTSGDGEEVREGFGFSSIMVEKVTARGMNITSQDLSVPHLRGMCDAAVIFGDELCQGKSKSPENSCIRRGLLAGGVLWLIVPIDGMDQTKLSVKIVEQYSEAVWDTDSIQTIYSSSRFHSIRLKKRACLVNAWTCPWMDKASKIGMDLQANHPPGMTNENGITPQSSETHLQYERRVANDVTITPSVAERTKEKIVLPESGDPVYATVLTEANTKKAIATLQMHGFVVIKGLIPPEQTIPWGKAVLSDFASAVDRLKNHPTRPVDLINPQTAGSGVQRAFEPLSYKEMAMREDLRVDLRSGPEMEKLRRAENDLAYQSIKMDGYDDEDNLNDGPSTVDSTFMGTTRSWRFHPSLVAILKGTFNPRHESLFRGNFGRWNFGGSGPDGSPQPLRIGQIGN